MKCQVLFSGKNISVCLLLKTLPKVLKVKVLVLCIFVAGSCGCSLSLFFLNPVCFLLVFGCSCLALRSSHWGKGNWLLWLLLVCGYTGAVLSTIVCLLFLLVSLVIVALPAGHLLYYFSKLSLLSF